MFSWFKKKKEIQKCKHYKSAGDPVLDNMKKIVSFSDLGKEHVWKYSVSQCSECGKREFGCLHSHTMSDYQAQIVDEFINYKIDFDVFLNFLKTQMKWYELEKTDA